MRATKAGIGQIRFASDKPRELVSGVVEPAKETWRLWAMLGRYRQTRDMPPAAQRPSITVQTSE